MGLSNFFTFHTLIYHRRNNNIIKQYRHLSHPSTELVRKVMKTKHNDVSFIKLITSINTSWVYTIHQMLFGSFCKSYCFSSLIQCSSFVVILIVFYLIFGLLVKHGRLSLFSRGSQVRNLLHAFSVELIACTGHLLCGLHVRLESTLCTLEIVVNNLRRRT